MLEDYLRSLKSDPEVWEKYKTIGVFQKENVFKVREILESHYGLNKEEADTLEWVCSIEGIRGWELRSPTPFEAYIDELLWHLDTRQKDIECKALVLQMLDSTPFGVPIFVDELIKEAMDKIGQEHRFAKVTVKETLIKQLGILVERFDDGIFYKPKMSAFGKSPLNPSEVICKRYIQNEQETFGYETGLSLLQKIGLTTQMPKWQYIASNREETNGDKERFHLVLQKPKTEITPENAKYLQLLDLLEDDVFSMIETKNYEQIFAEMILKYQLNIDLLLSLASTFYSKEVFERIKKITALCKA